MLRTCTQELHLKFEYAYVKLCKSCLSDVESEVRSLSRCCENDLSAFSTILNSQCAVVSMLTT